MKKPLKTDYKLFSNEKNLERYSRALERYIEHLESSVKSEAKEPIDWEEIQQDFLKRYATTDRAKADIGMFVEFGKVNYPLLPIQKKEEKEIEVSDAVEFSEWLYKNDWIRVNKNEVEFEKRMGGYRHGKVLHTASAKDLYKSFRNEHPVSSVPLSENTEENTEIIPEQKFYGCIDKKSVATFDTLAELTAFNLGLSLSSPSPVRETKEFKIEFCRGEHLGGHCEFDLAGNDCKKMCTILPSTELNPIEDSKANKCKKCGKDVIGESTGKPLNSNYCNECYWGKENSNGL